MRTPCYLLRSIRQRVVRVAAGSGLSEASRGSLGCLAKLAIKMMHGRFGPSTW